MSEHQARNLALEEEILAQGPVMRNKLILGNYQLIPSGLGLIIPAYNQFKLSQTNYLWSREKSLDTVSENVQYPKVFFLLSGVSKAGKHELIRRLKAALGDQITGLVTTTTRDRKPDEIDHVDHDFISLEKFQQGLQNDEFIEAVEQSKGWYGTPKVAIDKVLYQGGVSVIFTDVEIGSGWPTIEKYIKSLPLEIQPRLLKMFMLTEASAVNYFKVWLPKKLPDDFERRGIRSAWEIWNAPERTEFVLTNPIMQGPGVFDEITPIVVAQIQQFLLNPLQLKD